ncbi:MAG: hypothetical protein HY513_00405 [Candidatus Aenigmarchaeota archaeon]|nr:hypothetical protein [Candidatus Aenigmarchaeota archaeon]
MIEAKPKKATVWDVDRVWYPDISTTYCAKGRDGNPNEVVAYGLEKSYFKTSDIDRWSYEFNQGRPVETYGQAADMFTAFYNKMYKEDEKTRILTKEQTIELKQRLLKGMRMGDVNIIASRVQLTDGLVPVTHELESRRVYQSAFSDGLAPFVSYWMYVCGMNYGAVVPTILEEDGGERLFVLASDSRLFTIDSILTGKTLQFNKRDSIKNHYTARNIPLSDLAVIDDSEAALPLMGEVQQAGGLSVGFNVLPGQVPKFREAGVPIIKGNSLLPFAELVLQPTEANLGRYCE